MNAGNFLSFGKDDNVGKKTDLIYVATAPKKKNAKKSRLCTIMLDRIPRSLFVTFKNQLEQHSSVVMG